MTDLNAAFLANALPGETIPQTLARMEAENAQFEANEREANENVRFNFWRRYRVDPAELVPPDMTIDEMNQFKAARRNDAYVPPQRQAHGAIPAFGRYVKRDIIQPPTDPASEKLKKEFIDQHILELVGQWKGIKAFDGGASAHVGLWEYTGPQENNPRFPKRVIVKELFPDDMARNLKEEAQIMGRLGKASSAHIVRLLLDAPAENSDSDDDAEDDVEVTRRIIMEYCSQGTLLDLFERRLMKYDPPKPFDERSLWRIFDCLVDACSVLQYGCEVSYDPATDRTSPQLSNMPAWEEIYHSDIKPDNVFLGERDMYHSWTPVCKLGDYGFAVSWPELFNNLPDDWKEGMRERGTERWFPPEHFTERWDYDDWSNSPIAGRFSPPTNIWAMGAIMWHLVMLQNPPHPSTAFVPSWQMKGNPAKGLTYGIEMWGNNNYSQTLRNLIYECLYEMPEHRPTIRDLKKAVVLGWQDAERASGPGGEPWEDFKMPDPTDSQPEQHGQQQQEEPDPNDPNGDDNSDHSSSGRSAGRDTPDEDSDNSHDNQGATVNLISTGNQPSQSQSSQRRPPQRQPSQRQPSQRQPPQRQSSQNQSGQTQTQTQQQPPNQRQSRQQGQSRRAASSNQPSGARPNVQSNQPANLEQQYSRFVRLTVFVQQYDDTVILRKVTHWEFPATEVVSIMTVRELKKVLTNHGCQIWPQFMYLQVLPTQSFPKRVILDDDNRTLLQYGLTDRNATYYINMYQSPDPIPEEDPPGSMGYHLLFRMMNGRYGRANQDFLLRGLGSTYTVDKVMTLLQAKCGVDPNYQEWRVPVLNWESPLQNYRLKDGDQVQVWDTAVGPAP